MITSISRDWGSEPCMVRLTCTDNLATITTAGYLLDEADNISLLNNGAFEWLEGDLVAINYSDGEGFFTRDAVNNSFVVEVVPGALSETLSDGQIFVGDALNVAKGVAMSGDIAIDNAGVTAIQAGVVENAMLEAALQPSHVVKYAAQHTTGGGGAAEAITVTGALATDLAFVQLVNEGTNTVTVENAVVTLNTLTVTFSGDPGNDAIINYQILRAV